MSHATYSIANRIKDPVRSATGSDRERPLSSLREYVRFGRELIERELERVLPPSHTPPEKVHMAMRYCVLGGGKRLRPLLTLAVADMLRAADLGRAVSAGCAVELVHAASLIFDDLPCMDNAAMRRGKRTCHLEFGESTALLAAIALLGRSFKLLQDIADDGVPLGQVSELTAQLALAIGSDGLVGGQSADLDPEKLVDFSMLEFVHRRKTGTPFIVCAEFGSILGGASPSERAAILEFAMNLGLAFQVQDDLLDAVATCEQTGKDAHKDAQRKTFVSFYGVEGARRWNRELIARATGALVPFGKRAAMLDELARFFEGRKT